jgi:glutathione S-transferase
MSFVIHGIPGSPYVRSPLIALEEKGAEYRLQALPFGTYRTPDYLRMQPFGKIPAFEHDGMTFYETQAFLRYLDRVMPSPALAPRDARALLRMDQMLNIVDCYVAQTVSGGLSFGRVVAPKFGMPVDEAAIAAALPDAKVAIDEIARLLGGNAYMAGDALSLADIHLICHLDLLPLYAEGRELLAPHPNLAVWIERMDARPSLKATTWERVTEMSAVSA